MPFCPSSRARSAAGFTLLEVMITVGIVGILAAIALPNYSAYVQRGKIVEATSKLGDLRTDMERFFMDNRTYAAAGNCGIDNGPATRIPQYNADAGKAFQITCAATATTYTITATGLSAKGMANFAYTINQLNQKTTTNVPTSSGWTGIGANCFVIRKDGTCS